MFACDSLAAPIALDLHESPLAGVDTKIFDSIWTRCYTMQLKAGLTIQAIHGLTKIGFQFPSFRFIT